MTVGMPQRWEQGFTLIEIMIVLVITMIGLLGLGSFSIYVMDAGAVSRERLVAVHLAEQVIEEWQRDSNDYLPTIAADCSLSSAAAAPTYPASSACIPAAGAQVSYTVVASVAAAQAPLSDGSAFQNMAATAAYPNTPQLKLVTVSWSHKGTSKSIYLTHLTR